jgi:hypothetical protein
VDTRWILPRSANLDSLARRADILWVVTSWHRGELEERLSAPLEPLLGEGPWEMLRSQSISDEDFEEF